MNTLDENIFTDCICPYLTGKIIDDILLVNKQYNKVVKADKTHLYSLFWTIETKYFGGRRYKFLCRDGQQEGEQLEWYPNGRLSSKYFYKDGKREGEYLDWYADGKLLYKEFYSNGNLEGDQLCWYPGGYQLCYKSFYRKGKKDGEQLRWHDNGKLQCRCFYKDGKKDDGNYYSLEN